MRLNEGCVINNVARLDKAEEIEKESSEIDKEIENTPAPVEIHISEAEDEEAVSEEQE